MMPSIVSAERSLLARRDDMATERISNSGIDDGGGTVGSVNGF
jgi:hypothetical protein